jgi:RNA polymerase sigma-70 factor (ECF subfamily)
VSQIGAGRRCIDVNASELNASEVNATADVAGMGAGAPFDFEAIFRAQYERIARVIRRVVHDPARAEELTVEVFLKLWRSPEAQGEKAEAWLYRSAVRKSLDELRRRPRRTRYESFFGFVRAVPTPEDIRAAAEEQERVRLVLAVIQPRHAELLLLRSQDLSYDELASALDLNPASIGTLLSRAQQAFRKEYIKRYGEQ